ncbi:GTP cyclohydrolase, partial [Streptomyces sp. NPDC001220]
MRDSGNATASRYSSNPTSLSAATLRTRVTVPLRFGDGHTVTADLATFHHLADGREHVAVVLGDPAPGTLPLVRLHSECLTGDVFGSARCDCGPQLREAVERIAE